MGPTVARRARHASFLSRLSGDDWQKTLLHLTERRIHLGGCLWQEVPLGCPPSEGFPRITQHSAKLQKPCVYAVARVHSTLPTKPGAWADGKIDASSVGRMLKETAAIEPRLPGRTGLAVGLRVTKGYAASGLRAAEAPTAPGQRWSRQCT